MKEKETKPSGKNIDNDNDGSEAEEKSIKPDGVGNKRISTSDDDSDIIPRVVRKKKARKLNDLNATSNEDDSDEDFKGTSTDVSDSEEGDEEASMSGSSFVVDDDSDSDVVDVSVKRKARTASPTIRRSTRSARKKYNARCKLGLISNYSFFSIIPFVLFVVLIYYLYYLYD